MNLQLVENWRHLWKAACMWALAAGALLPDVLQLVADNSDSLIWLDDGWKSIIRLICILLAMVLRTVKQKAVSGPA